MTAFSGTPAATARYTSQIAPYTKANALDIAGVMQMAFSGTYTHALGAGTGEVNLLVLPAGKIRVYPDLSRLVTTQFATSAVLDIGHRAYVGSDGVTVVEDAADLHNDADVNGAAFDGALTLPAAGYRDFDSQDGVVIFATIASGNIEDDDTIELHVAYTRLI